MPTDLTALTSAISDITDPAQLTFLEKVITAQRSELKVDPPVLGITVVPRMVRIANPHGDELRAEIHVCTTDDVEGTTYTADYNGIELAFDRHFKVIDARGADAVDG